MLQKHVQASLFIGHFRRAPVPNECIKGYTKVHFSHYQPPFHEVDFFARVNNRFQKRNSVILQGIVCIYIYYVIRSKNFY